MNHEVIKDSYSAAMPNRNETKFFAVKQVLAEFDEVATMGPGLTTFQFSLDIEPGHKKPPSFLIPDLPLREVAENGEESDSSSETPIIGFLTLECLYTLKVRFLGNMFIDQVGDQQAEVLHRFDRNLLLTRAKRP